MKVTLLILILLVGLNSQAQTSTKTRKVVPVLTQQDFYLNDGLHGLVGGKSRTIFAVALPQNTVEWYYVLTTAEGQSTGSSLNLVPQLTKLLATTGIGMAEILASSILTPTGSNSCDVYLLDKKGSEAFENKADKYGSGFSRYTDYTRENFRNGTVQIKDLLQGTFYLGVRNPSAKAGINIKLEIAAIVEETTIDNSVWAVPTKERFSNIFYNKLIQREVPNGIARKISNCMVAKMTTDKTPETYGQMTRTEKESYFENLITECSDKYKIKKTLEQEKAITYGNLGWTAYEEGDIEKCIAYSKKALALDNSLGYVRANLGLCYLLKNDEVTATDYYIDALSDFKKESKTKKNNIEAVIKDIDDVLKKSPSIKGASTIKSLFQSELKNN
ncbi:MAG: tetratricopeptide repeat protein [Bacteroidetes bacterium]|nr:tetratricopeptide repeat protein [Bacteroidota bacterium]MBS1672231.1 tetratricopeptide repeat protein [Bacteroidota bacterium]